MRRFRTGWAPGLVLAILATPSAAFAARLVRSADQVAILSAGQLGVRSYLPGQYIFDSPLAWSTAGIIAEDRSVTIGNRTTRMSAAVPLPAAILQIRPGSAESRGYCSPRRAAERSLDHGMGAALFGGVLTRKLVKSETDAQFCLIDTDLDGQLDEAVLVNAGSESDRVTPIRPVGFREASSVPIGPGDELRLLYRGTGFATSAPMFELQIVQQGKARAFTSISHGSGATARTADRITFASSKAGWPVAVDLLDLRFVVTGLDATTKSVTIDWTQGSKDAVRMTIPDNVRYILRNY